MNTKSNVFHLKYISPQYSGSSHLKTQTHINIDKSCAFYVNFWHPLITSPLSIAALPNVVC